MGPPTARANDCSERTPLLRAASDQEQNGQNGSAIYDDDVQASEVAAQWIGGAPQFPKLGKSRSYSHGQLVVPNDDSVPRPEQESLVRFQKNGKLDGIGEWKFMFVFGGILVGYFVSSIL